MSDEATAPPSSGIRVDKWLWQARFFKSRSLATRHCGEGRVRLNGTRLTKAHALVRPGDVLTFPCGPHIRVIRVVAAGWRRGPAVEARALYEDIDPPPPGRPETGPPSSRVGDPAPVPVALRARGAGRPTKAARRALDRLRDAPGDSSRGG